MLQYAIFLVSVLRFAPLSALLPGLDGPWLARLGHLLTG